MANKTSNPKAQFIAILHFIIGFTALVIGMFDLKILSEKLAITSNDTGGITAVILSFGLTAITFYFCARILRRLYHEN